METIVEKTEIIAEMAKGKAPKKVPTSKGYKPLFYRDKKTRTTKSHKK